MIELPQFILAEARRAQHFATLVENIKRLNNLDQAESEARARLAALAKDEADARARLAALTGQITAAEANERAFMAEIANITKGKA